MILTSRLIIIFLVVSLSTIACKSYNQSSEPELEEKPTIEEKKEIELNPQSLDYQYKADFYNEDLYYNFSEKSEQQKLEQSNKVIDYYTKAIAADPRNSSAYEGRANIYNRLEQYDKAIADLTQSIVVDPQNISAYSSRAKLYFLTLKEPSKAVDDLTKAISLATKDKSLPRDKSRPLPLYEFYHLRVLYKWRVYAYMELEQYDKAIADSDRIIALEPEEATNYNFRAYVYSEAKQYDLAIADYTKAIKLLPNYAHAYKNRGQTYAKLKQYDLAIADYTKALSSYSDYSSFGSNNVDYANAYVGRADVYRELKQYDLAIADYDNALKVYSEFAFAYKKRGEFYQELGNIAQARQDLEKAASLYQQQDNIEEYQIVQQQLQQL